MSAPEAIIAGSNPATGELMIPICWQDEWFILPIFAIAYGPDQSCLWRRGWRKVAGLVGNEVRDERARKTIMNGT